MNTSTLKAFAPAVRRQLMEAVALKLDFVLAAQIPDYLSTFAPQVAALRNLAQTNSTGLIERVAYTWFNRLTALRYLDARGWHPFNARVLTPATPAETQPELLKLTRAGALPKELKEHTDPARLNDLLDGHIPSPDPQGEVYRHLVLAACRFYHALLPDVFEKLDDETELLLPDDLLTGHSVVSGFRTQISDTDCAEVELLGWFYQFYISERKDQVMARKSAVPAEDIPAITQLFTPHWIVRYLVENSLGRLWLMNRPGSQLRKQMPYYIEADHQTDFLKISKPEEIRVLDPACGSGHMLTYAFDLLYAIYEEEGYSASDIAALILRHNLHGIDVCPRAAQLAALALLFKAREKSRRFFQPEYLVRPNVMELREVRFAENELRNYIRVLELGELFNESLLRLMYQFEEAKHFGSLIQPCLDEQMIAFVRGTVEAKDLGSQLFLHETHRKVLTVLEQAAALTQSYYVAVANPPYLGTGKMPSRIQAFAKLSYPDEKADLYSMFISRCMSLTRKGGVAGLITMHSWMFLDSFERLRENVIQKHQLQSMLHLGPRAFDFISGEVVQSTAFTICAWTMQNTHAEFFRLVDSSDSESKESAFLRRSGHYTLSPAEFKKLPGSPMSYWIPEALRRAFATGRPLSSVVTPKKGLITSDNGRFLRLWHEVGQNRSAYGCESRAASVESGRRWFPYNKGGGRRKWFGSNEYFINWERDGEEVIEYAAKLYGSASRQIQNKDSYFQPSITWTAISSSGFTARYCDVGFVFDSKGPSIFGKDRDLKFCLALLMSGVGNRLLGALNSTMDYLIGNVSAIPLLPCPTDVSTSIIEHVNESIQSARMDWNSFETSWDFCDHPLLRPCLKGVTLEASWRNWDGQCTAAIRRMQELETENNRLFIDAYGLQDELSPEVPEEQITLARADARRDMAGFLSYAIGCMMGRYSLDHAGLILANAGDSLREFLEKARLPQDKLAFTPDEDGIIPVLDGEWFENDIVARIRDFLRATFGEATLRENIRFAEESLGRDLRKYCLTDFYKDHLQTYKKRPIYWMVQSPRKGFSALIYLHRYTRDTMNLVLNKYLREYEVKLRNRLNHLTIVQAGDSLSARDKTAARKEADKLLKTLHDCEEWERQTILPLAQARIELDLDDGVKTNYLKLGEALAPIAGIAAEDE